MKCSWSAILLALFMVPCTASAVPITFDFSGTIASVGSDINDGTFSSGQSVLGQYTFESTTADTDASSNVGSYTGAISNVSFTFGTYSGTAGPGNIVVRDDFAFVVGTFDAYEARGIPGTGGAVNARDLETFNFQLLDDTLTMLSSDALPLTAPSPFRNDNGNTTFLILQFDPTNSVGIVRTQVRATVDSVTLISRVPEPSTLMLMGIGLVGLGWMGRRRKKLN